LPLMPHFYLFPGKIEDFNGIDMLLDVEHFPSSKGFLPTLYTIVKKKEGNKKPREGETFCFALAGLG
jgi:hypothetical protein